MIGEDAVAGNLAPRHVTTDTVRRGRDGASLLRRSRSMTRETRCLVMGMIARSPVVGIVAGRAAQTARAVGIAGGHRHADPLKPNNPRIAGVDRRGRDQSGHPVAYAALIDLVPGPAAMGAHRHCQFLLAASRRLDVGFPRAVAALAGDVGDQGRSLEQVGSNRRDPGSVAADTLPEMVRAQPAPERDAFGRVSRLPDSWAPLLPGRDREPGAVREN